MLIKYVIKMITDIKGLAEAINSAATVEELDEYVCGKKEKAAQVRDAQPFQEVI